MKHNAELECEINFFFKAQISTDYVDPFAWLFYI